MKKFFLPAAFLCTLAIVSCAEKTATTETATTGTAATNSPAANAEGPNTATPNTAGTTAVASDPVAETTAPSDKMMITKKTANADVTAIVNAYLQVKNALAEDKTGSAATAAMTMAAAVKKTSATGMTAEQKSAFSSVSENLSTHAGRINALSGDIDRQRMHFEALSSGVEKLARNFQVQPLYKDFCPMAFDGKGANWLSETEAIHNPYFGAKMPRCGEAKEQI